MPVSASQHFAVASTLTADAAEVWAHATRPEGVNHELAPLVQMTFPAGTENFSEGWQPGERLFRSWILLFGLLPIDYDDLTLVELEPGRRFLERSKMGSQRVWEHERVIEPAEGGCRVTDRLRFEPKLPILGPASRWIFLQAFRLRHRNLRRRFGGSPASP